MVTTPKGLIMRIARLLISVAVVAALGFLGVHLAPALARIADLTDIQAGLMFGAVITWAAFRIDALIHPTPTQPN